MIGTGDESAWVSRFLRDAETEARRRGESCLGAAHLALALARPGTATGALFTSVGLEPSDWRDEIIRVLGWSEGATALREGRPAGAMSDAPADRHFDGVLQLGPDTQAVLEAAEVEAAANGSDVGAAHLLVGLLLEGGSVGAATARWLGLTVGRVRSAAGLRNERRVVAGGARPGSMRRGSHAGPVVVGGGGGDHALLTEVVSLARSGDRSRPPRAVVVDLGWARLRPTPEERQLVLDALVTAGAAEAVDSGLIAREDATAADVCRRLAGADLVWFTGGDAAAIYDRLWSTPALDAIWDAHDNGALVGGVSAGAMVWGAGTLSDFASGDPEPFPLFGWLEDLVVFPHYWPTRQRSLRERLKAFPGCRGIGVAHGGAVVVGATTRDVRPLRSGAEDVANVLLTGPDNDVRSL